MQIICKIENKKMKKIGISLILFYIICVSAAGAENDPPYRLDPTDYVKTLAGKGDDAGIPDLEEASLVFSGVEDGELERYRELFLKIVEDLKKDLESGPGDMPVPEMILHFMHENVLTGYKPYQTYMNVLLDSGQYNCVSSAILYLILVKSAGIPVWGIKTRDHAFCRVIFDEKEYDVETTTIHGFDPGSKKEFHDEFGNVTGFSYVSPKNYSKRKDVTEIGLISLILGNRITYLTDKKNFIEPVGLSVDIYSLVKDQDNYNILIGSFNNLGAYYNQMGLFKEGEEFLDKVIAAWGADEKILEVKKSLIHNQLLELVNRNSFDEALDFIREYYTEDGKIYGEGREFFVYIYVKNAESAAESSFQEAIKIINKGVDEAGPDKSFTRAKSAFVYKWIMFHVNKSEFDAACDVLKKLDKVQDITSADYEKYLEFIYLSRADSIFKKEGNLEAAEYLKSVSKNLKNHAKVDKAYNAYIHNYEVDVHNRMVRLFNQKKYREAKAVIKEALKLLPDSKKFKSDLELVEKALKDQ
ncbi:MAG: hypothetical protein JW969_05045 [Spirochaetales bacterium]|nr:hypothetical protein [Spirochaetales bacterium]